MTLKEWCGIWYLQELDTAPLEIFHIPSIPPVCTSKVPHFFLLLDAKDALTMIARFMNQIIFRGDFGVAWGTVCHQDAFATMLVGREHTFQSITSVRKSHERYYPTPPHPTPNDWRSASIASRVYASHMNVIIPPHLTQTPHSKSSTTTRAVFHPLAKTCFTKVFYVTAFGFVGFSCFSFVFSFSLSLSNTCFVLSPFLPLFRWRQGSGLPRLRGCFQIFLKWERRLQVAGPRSKIVDQWFQISKHNVDRGKKTGEKQQNNDTRKRLTLCRGAYGPEVTITSNPFVPGNWCSRKPWPPGRPCGARRSCCIRRSGPLQQAPHHGNIVDVWPGSRATFRNVLRLVYLIKLTLSCDVMLGRMSLHLSSTCVPHLSPTQGVLERMSLHLCPACPPLVSHTCLPLWVPWAAWVYTCLPLVSHSGFLGPHEFTLVSPLSPALVSHSGCLGPHEFTLVSHLSLTLGCLGPHEFTLVSHACLPLWVSWSAWIYTCLPHLSSTLVSHSGCLGPHESPTCLPHLSPSLGVLGRMILHLSPTCLPHLSPTLVSHTCLPLWVPWAAWVYTGFLGPHEFTLVSLSHSGCLGPREFTLVFH